MGAVEFAVAVQLAETPIQGLRSLGCFQPMLELIQLALVMDLFLVRIQAGQPISLAHSSAAC